MWHVMLVLSSFLSITSAVAEYYIRTPATIQSEISNKQEEKRRLEQQRDNELSVARTNQSNANAELSAIRRNLDYKNSAAVAELSNAQSRLSSTYSNEISRIYSNYNAQINAKNSEITNLRMEVIRLEQAERDAQRIARMNQLNQQRVSEPPYTSRLVSLGTWKDVEEGSGPNKTRMSRIGTTLVPENAVRYRYDKNGDPEFEYRNGTTTAAITEKKPAAPQVSPSPKKEVQDDLLLVPTKEKKD